MQKGLMLIVCFIFLIGISEFSSASYSTCPYGNYQPTTKVTGGGGTNITNYINNTYINNSFLSLGVNETQLENATILNIKESWIDSLWQRIIGLPALVIGWVGNWSSDKGNYYTKPETDANLSNYYPYSNPNNYVNTSSSGNYFNQQLNTTNNVQFSNLTLSQKITFALGGIIDNIVNGWIRITGNVNITGNLTVGENRICNATGVFTCTTDQTGAGGSSAITNRTMWNMWNRNATAYNQSVLTLAMNANSNYTIKCNIEVASNGTTAGVHLNISYPLNRKNANIAINHPTTATAPAWVSCGNITSCLDTSGTSIAYPSFLPVSIDGLIETSSAGNFEVTMKSEFAGGNATIFRGSYCSLTSVS